MPRKILNSYGGFTADQWKTFTTLFSIYALYDILPRPDLELWREFVLACSLICSPLISEARALLAHTYFMNFCKGFEQLYGKHQVTHNMHLHTHLVDCILDYGPVYSFWLFIFGSLASETEREADKLIRCHEQRTSTRQIIFLSILIACFGIVWT